MGRHDWYRNEVWNDEIEKAFEEKFKRARDESSKCQYLQIQADCLLRSNDKESRPVGLKMMERFFREYPHDIPGKIMAWRSLAEYSMDQKSFQDAEMYFARVIDACKKHKNYASYVGLSELKIVEIIFVSNQIERFEEAYRRLIDFPSVYNDKTFFNNELFYLYDVAARLCFAMEKRDEAKQYATKALKLAETTEPQLPRHPSIGLVKVDRKQISVLEAIIKD